MPCRPKTKLNPKNCCFSSFKHIKTPCGCGCVAQQKYQPSYETLLQEKKQLANMNVRMKKCCKNRKKRFMI